MFFVFSSEYNHGQCLSPTGTKHQHVSGKPFPSGADVHVRLFVAGSQEGVEKVSPRSTWVLRMMLFSL